MSESPQGTRSEEAAPGLGTLHIAARKRARTRTGCWNCRRRRKKCNERRPVCSNCSQKGETCEWGIRLSFRDENVQTISESHPSMRQDTATRQVRSIEVVDITDEVIRDYWSDVQEAEHHEYRQGDNTATITNERSTSGSRSDHGNVDNDIAYIQGGEQMTRNSTIEAHRPAFVSAPPIIRPMHRGSGDMLAPAGAPGVSMSSPFGDPSHDSPASATTSHSYDMVQFAAVQLLDLGGAAVVMSPTMNNRPTQAQIDHQMIPSPLEVMNDTAEASGISPEQLLADDGIFMPGSAYLELHSALRSHIFDTARSTYPSRRQTPSFSSYDIDSVTEPLKPALPFTIQTEQVVPSSDTTPRSPELTKQEEFRLWKNWVDEIAPWLDKFDNECHFRHKLPPLAKEHSHLRYSILALSARQLERKHSETSSSASLALYQEAIHQLVPHLQTKTTPVVASCVVLCVLEMMDCSPQMWRRHLDGCACLIQALGLNGFSGGMEQALFWCFARMDVCGGFISAESTLIPAPSWTPRMSLSDAVELFRKTPGFDMYANFAVFLCAQVLDLFACEDSDAEFTRRWNELFAHVESWFTNRPPEMRSILSQPATPGEDSHPFPTLLFSNPSAISGNQLYHTAALLMLQKKPRRAVVSSKTRPVLWHARRICAISICNTHHGCWTNCIQPLWIAGQVMSHHAEHRAILEAYETIERETGWGATWRAEDLKTCWGELDDG